MLSETSRAGRIAVRLVPFLAVLATLLAFLPALRCGFVDWDDPMNFLNNEHYRGLGLDNLRWMFTTLVPGNYQPLSWLTWAVDYKLWGMSPHGYHLSNVVIHAANAGLLCLVCMVLLAWIPPKTATPKQFYGWPLAVSALFGALFWSLHPLRVESVAWVTERRDVLSTAFYLATVLCYLRWTQHESRRWWWAALTAYVLSLLSKAMGMTLPVALLILDIYPLRRLPARPRAWLLPQWRGRLLEKLPFAALGTAAAGLGYAAQVETKATNSMAAFGLPERLAHAAYDLVFYLSKTLFPIKLAPFYEMVLPFNPYAPCFLFSALAACAIAALVWLGRKSLPGLAAAMGFYAVTVSPVLGLVAIGSFLAADRYTYVPTLGFSVLAAGALWGLLTRPMVRIRAPVLAICMGLVLTLAGLSWRQCGFWRDSDALWGRVLALDPSSPSAHHNLGVELAAQGNYAAALRMYQSALIMRPHSPLVQEAFVQAAYNVANAALHSGRRQEALRLYRKVLNLSPTFAEAHNNLGLALTEAGQKAEARRHYEQALGLKPGFAAAHYNLGNAFAEEGRLAQAEAEFRRAAALDETLLDARFNLANTLARQGRYGKATDQYRAVLRKSPDFPQARENLGKVRRLGGL